MAFIGEDQTPLIYENLQVRNVTRWGLFQEVYKVLLAFGFKRVYPFGWEWFREKPLELVNPEDTIGLLDEDVDGSWALFDFPDDYEFTNEGSSIRGTFPYGAAYDPEPLDGRSWRPCVAVWIANQPTGDNDNDFGNWWGIELVNRRAGTQDQLVTLRDYDINGGSGYFSVGGGTLGSLIRNRLQDYGSTILQYHGNAAATLSSELPRYLGTGPVPSLLGAAEATLFNPYATYNGEGLLIPVKSFRMILSKGGLLIQIGRGTRKDSNNDLVNFLFCFGGRRIPGRARPAAEDIDRDQTNHVYALSFNDTSNDFGIFSASSTSAPRGYSFGARFTDPDPSVGTVLWSGGVEMQTFNFDNVDRIPFSSLWNYPGTRLSPRNIGGAGFHVLSRWIYTTHRAMANYNILLGTRDLAVSTSNPFWRWYEAYYCPHLVWADPVAPSGYFTDPASGIEYYFWKCQANGTIAGIEVEGRGTTLTPATLDAALPSHTLIDETLYTLASGSIAIDGASVGSVPVSQIGALYSSAAIDAGANEVRWTAWSSQSVDIWGLEFDVSGDPEGYGYEVVAELLNTSGSASTGPGVGTNPDANNLLLGRCDEMSTGGLQVACVSGGVRNSGGDPTEPGDAFADSSFWCHRTRDTKTVRFYFATRYRSGTSPKTIAMRNVRLRRYQLAGGIA